LRDPGQTHKETLATGAAAAAAGGFTTIVAMPNTSPPIDREDALRDLLDRAAAFPEIRILQTATLSAARHGRELANFATLRDAGAPALTDDGGCLSNARLMRDAMLQAKAVGLPGMDPCEDASRAEGTVAHGSATARELNLPARSRVAEELVVARDILLAEETACPVHIQHVSARRSVELIRRARAQGVPVTAEVTPHHLVLTHQACRDFGTLAKVNPPLGDETDRQALIEAVKDGTISAIATDHAPHTLEEKQAGWRRAPFGIAGLETVVPVCCTELVHGGLLTWPRLVELFTTGPATVLGLQAGTLTPGAPADCTILDPNAESVLKPDQFLSKGKNTPFADKKCRGRALGTIRHGEPSAALRQHLLRNPEHRHDPAP
jgi:dihydroorotase